MCFIIRSEATFWCHGTLSRSMGGMDLTQELPSTCGAGKSIEGDRHIRFVSSNRDYCSINPRVQTMFDTLWTLRIWKQQIFACWFIDYAYVLLA